MHAPYPSYAYARSHPSHLAAAARLQGVEAPEVRTCRVLELGCANGGNLLAMALSLPEARFVGIDLDTDEVAWGNQARAACGLGNVEIVAMDARDLDARFGRFDYVVMHGFLSWVPRQVADHVLRFVGASLAPGGVVYVGYNALPGSGPRMVLRDVALQQAEGEGPARIASARAALARFAKLVGDGAEPHAQLLRAELARIAEAPDGYLEADLLPACNEAFAFREVVDRAAAVGLTYLAETVGLCAALTGRLHPLVGKVQEGLSGDVIDVEQAIDHLTWRPHRASLFCAGSPVRPVGPDRLRDQWLSSDLIADGAAFVSPYGTRVDVAHPVLRKALEIVGAAWPGAVRFEEVAGRLGGDPAMLAAGWLLLFGTNVVDVVGAEPHGFASTVGSRPVASPLSRWQAAAGFDRVATLRHRSLRIDAIDRELIRLLDGTRTHDELARDMGAAAAEGRVVLTHQGKRVSDRASCDAHFRKVLPKALEAVARQAVLVQNATT